MLLIQDMLALSRLANSFPDLALASAHDDGDGGRRRVLKPHVSIASSSEPIAQHDPYLFSQGL